MNSFTQARNHSSGVRLPRLAEDLPNKRAVDRVRRRYFCLTKGNFASQSLPIRLSVIAD